MRRNRYEDSLAKPPKENAEGGRRIRNAPNSGRGSKNEHGDAVLGEGYTEREDSDGHESDDEDPSG